jgi:hypothetical protein
VKTTVILLIALFISGTAAANNLDPIAEPVIKNNLHVGADPGTPDGREGGETIADAFVIPSLPFEDTGNTCDNNDDYDEACPYDGNLSGDEVYAFTPVEKTHIFIDLCESGYDTKVFVYENDYTPGQPFACNDDYPCDLVYRSAVYGLELLGGNTYYIVIDGYGGDCGDYLLTVDYDPPCELVCPGEGVAEGEPPLIPDYVDVYNSGCGAYPVAFQLIDYTTLCGLSGWYTAGEFFYRDTDWFSLFADEGGVITASAVSESDIYLYVLWPLDCAELGIIYDATCSCETPGTIEYDLQPGTESWLWVGPTDWDGPAGEFLYLLTLDGIELGQPSSLEQNSWGEVKSLFRCRRQ